VSARQIINPPAGLVDVSARYVSDL